MKAYTYTLVRRWWQRGKMNIVCVRYELIIIIIILWRWDDTSRLFHETRLGDLDYIGLNSIFIIGSSYTVTWWKNNTQYPYTGIKLLNNTLWTKLIYCFCYFCCHRQLYLYIKCHLSISIIISTVDNKIQIINFQYRKVIFRFSQRILKIFNMFYFSRK